MKRKGTIAKTAFIVGVLKEGGLDDADTKQIKEANKLVVHKAIISAAYFK